MPNNSSLLHLVPTTACWLLSQACNMADPLFTEQDSKSSKLAAGTLFLQFFYFQVVCELDHLEQLDTSL